MHIDFKDLSAAQSLGIFVEWRHTHILHKGIDILSLPSNARNHIKNVKNSLSVNFSDNHFKFNFKEAIQGNLEERERRKELAIKLVESDKAMVVTAHHEGYIIAGAFLVHDINYTYMIHTWRNKDSQRGAMNYVITSASQFVFENTSSKLFDLEGSVIQGIDIFFSSFGTTITPYGYVHWARENSKMIELINNSINISGRLC